MLDLLRLSTIVWANHQNTPHTTMAHNGMPQTLANCFIKKRPASLRTDVAQSIDSNDSLNELVEASTTINARTLGGSCKSNCSNMPAICKYELTIRITME